MKTVLNSKLDFYATLIAMKSKEICSDNQCTDDKHNCESYAYFDVKTDKNGKVIDITLLDICIPDYFAGRSNCAIPLPFSGDGKELLRQIDQYLELD